MLLARQVEGLGPGGGAAACIRRPLPVGVTVKHRNVKRVLKDGLREGVEEKQFNIISEHQRYVCFSPKIVLVLNVLHIS